MRIQICAVGRLRAGPERDLIDDYLSRFNRTGRALGFGHASVTEVEDKRGGGQAAEAVLLTRAFPAGALICKMDERGNTMTSPKFAHLLAEWRDAGHSNVSFIIGGADGLAPGLRADTTLSFGEMVWPHMLVRVMLAEQLYRAASILSGHPYHRT